VAGNPAHGGHSRVALVPLAAKQRCMPATTSPRHHPTTSPWRHSSSRARARTTRTGPGPSPYAPENARTVNEFGFTGRYLDKETGLYYFRARYYSGSLGRFVNRDPFEKSPFNSESYTTNRPNNDTLEEIDLIKESMIGISSQFSDDIKRQMKEFTRRTQALIDKSKFQPEPMDGYQDGLCLYMAYFAPNLVDPMGTDCPGCDIPSWVGGNYANSSPCILRCCAKHDECYKKNGCTASSWASLLNPFSSCGGCNRRVLGCIAKCAFTGGGGSAEYFCPKTGKYVKIPGDFPTLEAAKKCCCNDGVIGGGMGGGVGGEPGQDGPPKGGWPEAPRKGGIWPGER